MKLKVCGMRDRENILEVAKAGVDYMGFIFYAKSPRYVGEMFELPKEFPEGIKKVGVFVNEAVDKMLAIGMRLKLDYFQLHGHEPVEVCKRLKEEGFGVIKVFSVGDDFDFSITEPYAAVVDFFLFDTKGKYYGGNAQVFDWELLRKYDQQVPFFLSGGLTPENIGSLESLKDMNIHALDVNSGVEISPGVKDVEKIKELKRKAQEARHRK
jgi:phosphoribosylanthranilate isomerase